MAALLNDPRLLVLGLVIAVGLVIVVVAIFHYWYLACKAELDASLKREMLSRGMSAGEIRLVLDSREPSGAKLMADDLA